MNKYLIAAVIGLICSRLNAEEHKIQIMMTVPRTVSTAFERSMMERGDHKVFHEPWNSEYVYRNNLGSVPLPEIAEAGSYNGIKDLLYKYAEQNPVFIKDMIWPIRDEILNDEALLRDPNVVLTLLIRDPSLSIESFFQKISESGSLDDAAKITDWVFRYDVMVLLAEKYREIRGVWPMIIEAEELCTAPAKVMQDYCRRSGISYLPEALAWGKETPEQWEHTKRWHTDAAESEAFFIPKREAKVRFSNVPKKYVPHLEAIYQKQKPYYEQLQHMK